jgi:hypothetical protein
VTTKVEAAERGGGGPPASPTDRPERRRLLRCVPRAQMHAFVVCSAAPWSQESLDRPVVRTVLKALDPYREEKKRASEIDKED